MKTLAKLLGVAVVATGCVTSEPIDLQFPDAAGPPAQPILATGAGGDPNVSGQAGTGATTGTSGAAGSAAGAPGSGAAGSTTVGAAGATAGSSGAAGASGAAGGTGSGSGGSRDAGAPADATIVTDAGGSEVSAYAATWTDIYNKMLNNMRYASNCTGGGCHNPGTQKGLDLSTQAKGYTTIKGKLVAGNPGASNVISQLSGGKMPQARPKMPTADLNVIKAWIMAGAPNN